MNFIWLGVWFFVSALTITAFPLGFKIPMESQLAVYESLVTVSSFVFGVMGAWLALVYPETLKRVVDPSAKGKGDMLKTLKRLLIPMGISLGVIAVSMAVRLLTLVAKYSFELHSYSEMLRGASFSVATLSSCLVLIALLYAIAPGLSIEDEFKLHVDRQDRINRMKS